MVQNVFAQVLNWACEHGQQWNLCQHWENWSLGEWDIVLTWYGYRQCTQVVICFFDMNGFIEKRIIRTFGAKHREAW